MTHGISGRNGISGRKTHGISGRKRAQIRLMVYLHVRESYSSHGISARKRVAFVCGVSAWKRVDLLSITYLLHVIL